MEALSPQLPRQKVRSTGRRELQPRCLMTWCSWNMAQVDPGATQEVVRRVRKGWDPWTPTWADWPPPVDLPTHCSGTGVEGRTDSSHRRSAEPGPMPTKGCLEGRSSRPRVGGQTGGTVPHIGGWCPCGHCTGPASAPHPTLGESCPGLPWAHSGPGWAVGSRSSPRDS